MKLIRIIILLLAFIGLVITVGYDPTGVPILAYHKVESDNEIYSVSPVEFSRQMEYLSKQGYQSVSLTQLVDSFEGKYRLPSKPVVITFDDGYLDNYRNALPILQKYGMRATVFIIAGQVGQPEYLSWDDIIRLQQQGTEIGSHTVHHTELGTADLAVQIEEIQQSKNMLEQRLKVPVQFLAYPYGSFTDNSEYLLRGAGYRGACTGLPGLNDRTVNFFHLRRVNIPRPQFGLWEFRLRLLRAKLYYIFDQ